MKKMTLLVGLLPVAAGLLVGCDPEMTLGKRIDALPNEAWAASEWISVADAPVADAATRKAERAADGTSWFITSITNEAEVVSAKWMTTALGVYAIYVNELEVAPEEEFLKPGFTHVRKTRRSFTYELVDHGTNKEGQVVSCGLFRPAAGAVNNLAAEVSAGWWRDKIVNYAGQKSAFRGVLELTYADGRKKLYGTNVSDWKAGIGGPVLHAAIFDGEEQDGRIERPFDGTPDFKAPVRNDEFKGEILPSDGGEVYIARFCRDETFPCPILKQAYVWKGVEGADPEKEIFGHVVKVREYDSETIQKWFMEDSKSDKKSDTESKNNVENDSGKNKGEKRSCLQLDPGETLIFDCGQNFAGIPMLMLFKAEAGTKVTVLPAEMLNDANGERSRGNDGPAGSVYRENLRMPDRGMRFTYICKGGEELAFPRFTFFGFRYLSITVDRPVSDLFVWAIPVSSITERIGDLKTGVADVNQLISNVFWGQASNYLSVPTDCPQRNERLGWTADTQVFCEAGTFNADTRKFFHKWMRDMVDSRDADGGFPSVAPYAQYGNETFNLGWADAGVIVPWTIWKQFGDTAIIEENFEAMAKFVRKIDETKYKYDDKHYTYADWLSYQTFETSGNQFGSWSNWAKDPDARNYREYLAACYWLYDARLMVQMAEAIGKTDEAAFFRGCEKRAMDYIRATYFEADGLLLKPMRHLQTACIFALHFGIVEGAAREATKALLLKSIKDHGDCLQTGFLGTGFIMDTLTEIGASDVAYTLLLQHKNPSWLYSVDQGATTIWERWNSYTKEKGFGPVGMNSFNHYAYGAVLAWMYKTAAGIAADPTAPGFKRIIMKPVPDRRLGELTAAYKSAAGEIKSAWHYEGDEWVWDFTVPDGATALVTLPDGSEPKTYPAGEHSVRLTLK